MLRVAISGVTGRMGQTLVELLGAAPDAELAGGIAAAARAGAQARRYGCEQIVTPADAAELIAGADVVIDFSTPDALAALLEQQPRALAGRALVTGTTGLPAAVERRLDEAAVDGAVLVAANFSIGVHVLTRLVEAAAKMLPAADYDLEIVEAHHRGKADAPSGTALMLGTAAARGRADSLGAQRRDGRSGRTGARPSGEIGLHAVRGGGVIGDHHVLFLGSRERVELAHVALDRGLFAAGALTAAFWLAGQPAGRYTLSDLLDAGGHDDRAR